MRKPCECDDLTASRRSPVPRRPQDRQLLLGLEPVKTFGDFLHGRARPMEDHEGRPPMFHVLQTRRSVRITFSIIFVYASDSPGELPSCVGHERRQVRHRVSYLRGALLADQGFGVSKDFFQKRPRLFLAETQVA